MVLRSHLYHINFMINLERNYVHLILFYVLFIFDPKFKVYKTSLTGNVCLFSTQCDVCQDRIVFTRWLSAILENEIGCWKHDFSTYRFIIWERHDLRSQRFPKVADSSYCYINICETDSLFLSSHLLRNKHLCINVFVYSI